ncbi:hypothetical protein WME73_08960 [Sorangium sp. So ce302]|uniref:hypothetical protein n=1 Tax=Sorangium sp. So ce302 TaxID=3133297 RepID=UPI003F62866B
MVPPTVASRDDVLTYRQILEYMPPEQHEPSLLSRILQAILKFFGYKPVSGGYAAPTPASAEISAFRDTLAGLGSWDVVELNGGRVIFGDILGPAGAPRPVDVFDRAGVERIECSIDRPGWITALFREPRCTAELAVLRRDGRRSTASVPVDVSLRVLPAGQRDPVSYELRNMTNIEFGYRERPQFEYVLRDLVGGMRIVGRVSRVYQRGVFVDIGLRDGQNAPRDALALPSSFSAKYDAQRAARWFPVGKRVVVRVDDVIEEGTRVRVTILEELIE